MIKRNNTFYKNRNINITKLNKPKSKSQYNITLNKTSNKTTNYNSKTLLIDNNKIYQNNPLELTFGNSSFMSILNTENNEKNEVKDYKGKNSINKNKLKKKSNENQSPSLVIQIPQSIGSEDISTLDESVSITISRDFNLIYTKLKYVINPFISKEKKYNQILQWDLWGPLLLNLFLAFTLTFNTHEKGQLISLLFIIFWFGGSIIYLNNYFLGVKASIFQIYCLLGYCLFPLNISAIIVTIIHWNYFFRFIVVSFTCFWSIYSSSDYLKAITTQQNKRYLVLYPCILFYLYISWFIFATKV